MHSLEVLLEFLQQELPAPAFFNSERQWQQPLGLLLHPLECTYTAADEARRCGEEANNEGEGGRGTVQRSGFWRCGAAAAEALRAAERLAAAEKITAAAGGGAAETAARDTFAAAVAAGREEVAAAAETGAHTRRNNEEERTEEICKRISLFLLFSTQQQLPLIEGAPPHTAVSADRGRGQRDPAAARDRPHNSKLREERNDSRPSGRGSRDSLRL